MAMKLFTPRHLGVYLSLLFMTALGLTALDHWRPRPQAPLPDVTEQWDSRDVGEHLRGTGLECRVVGVDSGGLDKGSAFFTETDKTWGELNALPKTVESIASWRGSVFCRKVGSTDGWAYQMELWGENCLQVGPFIFFGDAELLGEIGESLATPSSLGATGG
jgi:hypothetical protein